MAMDKDRLGQNIWTFVKTQTSFGAALTAPLDAAGLALWTGIADEIIKEIQNHAVVTSTTSTPGAQSGGDTLPGTATGTVV
jgi:hypothetical protein